MSLCSSLNSFLKFTRHDKVARVGAGSTEVFGYSENSTKERVVRRLVFKGTTDLVLCTTLGTTVSSNLLYHEICIEKVGQEDHPLNAMRDHRNGLP